MPVTAAASGSGCAARALNVAANGAQVHAARQVLLGVRGVRVVLFSAAEQRGILSKAGPAVSLAWYVCFGVYTGRWGGGVRGSCVVVGGSCQSEQQMSGPESTESSGLAACGPCWGTCCGKGEGWCACANACAVYFSGGGGEQHARNKQCMLSWVIRLRIPCAMPRQAWVAGHVAAAAHTWLGHLTVAATAGVCGWRACGSVSV